MSATVEALRNLHRILRQLTDLRDRRAAGPKQIAAREVGLGRLEEQLQKSRDEHTATRVTADQKQLLLKSGETKIADLRVKLNACGTNREYQALMEHIAAAEMANSVLEDEILEGLEKIERYQIIVAEAQQGVAKGTEELEKSRHTVRQSAEVIAVDVERLETELKTAEDALPADFRDGYDRLVKAKGEDAMASLDDGCCGGCYQQATPNMYNDLILGRAIYCPGCGRLMYLPEGHTL